ncbi:MAG TPA: 6-phosphogluconolactonase [Candidatus Saccharimonadales bacterium]|nr:6-phosphogluconolactonase [Candidatus Saccharimonadales bacterium]
MTEVVLRDPGAVAAQAAAHAVETLASAIAAHGVATWGLAGGTSPLAAYAQLVADYADALDWSKVMVCIGDERCVAHDNPDSSWGQITKVLLADPSLARMQLLVPHAERGAEAGATAYEELLRERLPNHDGYPRIDLLWLGVGEDGHTLSLFPGHPALGADGLVVPVHDAPKPPPDRITLSLSAAAHASKLVVFGVGAAKKQALAVVQRNPGALPVGMLTQAAEQLGADVLWLYDQAAWPEAALYN